MLKIIKKIFSKKRYIKCPNCKSNKWIKGPSGGSFGNIKCKSCNKKYNNMGIFGLTEI